MVNTKTWSPQQQAIFQEFKSGKGNVVVRARAGTGKTTTILEGIGYAREGKILLAAFNKSIATELKEKLRNPNAEAKTLHSIGFGIVMNNWKGVKLNDERADKLAERAIANTPGRPGSIAPGPITGLVRKLAALGKGMCPFGKAQDLEDIAYEFECIPEEGHQNAGWTVPFIAQAAELAMTLAAQHDGTIDFDDMVYVPVRNGWLRGRYDLVVIDECQDMNATQILLAIGICRMGGRIFVVGDDRQAIYRFRGADSGSLDRLKTQLNAKELGLTITYRCPQLVVQEAQKLVPDYQAAPTAPQGAIEELSFDAIHEKAGPGDFVLSRKNAPLAKVCLRLLRHGTRAMIEGKDLGRQLLTVIKNLRAQSVPDFMEKLTIWERLTVERLEATKKKSAEAAIELVHDKAETLRQLAESMDTMADLVKRIETLFTETPNGKADYVVCSSVHKAKGRERDNVFALRDTLYPGGRQDTEEKNIHYVMVTRAKKKLVWVEGIS